MTWKQFCEAEYRRLKKLQNFQLPNYYKKIGMGLFILSFLALILLSAFATEVELTRSLFQKGLLIGLLMVSLAKDEIEDELTLKLRMQSYSMAFICGVLYAVIQPYVNYLFNSQVKMKDVPYSDLGDFQVLIFMLLIQLGFFGLLKRMR